MHVMVFITVLVYQSSVEISLIIKFSFILGMISRNDVSYLLVVVAMRSIVWILNKAPSWLLFKLIALN